MRIAIASDHAGFEQKESLRRHLVEQGHAVEDLGTDSAQESVDYPDYATAVGKSVASGDADGPAVAGLHDDVEP